MLTMILINVHIYFNQAVIPALDNNNAENLKVTYFLRSIAVVCCVSSCTYSIFRDKSLKKFWRNLNLTVIDLPNPKPTALRPYNEKLMNSLITRWREKGLLAGHDIQSDSEADPKLRKYTQRALTGVNGAYTGACHTEAGVMAMVTSIRLDEKSQAGPAALRTALSLAVRL